MEQPILSLNCLGWMLGVPREVLEDIAVNAVRYYKPFYLKRPGKKPRRIDGPNATLRDLQRNINKKILRPLEFPSHLHGGIRGRSPMTNASHHLGRSMVVRLDIEDFFPSVTDFQVFSVWRKRLSFSPPVARLLTALTTYRGHLPQGAPTSSLLANLVLLDADTAIKQAACASGSIFTRFVDDLVFSGDRPQDLIEVALCVLRKSGFLISRGKLVLMPGSALQEVTGYSVNSPHGPSVPRYRRDQIRAAIHQLGSMPRDAEFGRMVESIQGRISHIQQTNPGHAGSLLKQLERVVQNCSDGVSTC